MRATARRVAGSPLPTARCDARHARTAALARTRPRRPPRPARLAPVPWARCRNQLLKRRPRAWRCAPSTAGSRSCCRTGAAGAAGAARQLPLQTRARSKTSSVLRDALLRRVSTGVVHGRRGHCALRLPRALVGRHRRGTLLDWLEAAWRTRPRDWQRADAAGTRRSFSVSAAAVLLERPCAGLGRSWALLIQRRAAGSSDIDDPGPQTLGRATRVKATRRQGRAQAASTALARVPTRQAALELSPGTPCSRKNGDPRKHLGDDAAAAGRDGPPAAANCRPWRRQQAGAPRPRCGCCALSRVLLAEYAALKQPPRAGGHGRPGARRRGCCWATAPSPAGCRNGWTSSVRQVLIDEFQDTSPLQWQALHGWLVGLCRRRRWCQRAKAAGGVHRRRPQAEHLPLPRCRTARSSPRRGDFVQRGPRRPGAGAATTRGATRRRADQRRSTAVFEDAAARRRLGSLPRPHHGFGCRQAGRCCACPACCASRARKPPPAWPLVGAIRSPSRATEPETAAAAPPKRHRPRRCRGSSWCRRRATLPGEVMVLARTPRHAGPRGRTRWPPVGVPHVVAEPLLLHESPEALDLVAVLDVLVSPGHDLSAGACAASCPPLRRR